MLAHVSRTGPANACSSARTRMYVVDAELERVRADGREVRPDILIESQQSDSYAKV